ncbi:hypothetical protein, conserved [Eimeria maxima]|uniref:Uncharacterized protein n=1 Tax=Eimeria maxima TaxID=5804 RepID=U6MD67_EIMMA|nr:hypothetical protein, conserved [Eimeria maxima]CDJ60409.1 hypothetical protein, conserved [Eimeria maxima]
MQEPPRQGRQCHQHQGQQLLEQLWGPGDSTGSCPVPVALSSRFHLAGCAGATFASSPDCTVDSAWHSSCGGTLLFWDASTTAAPVTGASEPLACLQEAQGRSNNARRSLRSGALTYSIHVGASTALSLRTVLQQYLLQWQQRRIRASSSTVMRHVLVVEEERATFFLPERLPQSLCLCSLDASPVQQKLRPLSQSVPRCDFPVSRDSNSSSAQEFSAVIKDGQVTNAAKVEAAAGARVPNDCLVLSFLWAVASWFSRLADPLSVSSAAAAADLGLCSTTNERAAVLATTDPDAATAASGLAGALPALQQRTRAAASIVTAAAASLRGGFCLRLAALRTLAYWSCCCILAKQEATYNLQRNRLRKEHRQQMVLHAAASRLISTDMKQQSSSTSSSITLLRQLQQECRESFAQLLQQQQDAQQQLAERQGIEMESACAMREKQEQELKAATAPCCLPIQDSGDANDPTAVVAAAAALEACERDLQELVQQHLSECELLERHWIHEQQLLREQQLRMFKNVAADLYLLQHGSAAPYGAACQALVLPPLPSAGENERWAFNCKQQKQDQRRHEQLLQNQHPPPTWRQLGVAARQLFGRSGGGLSQEGDPLHHAHSYAICTSVASGASIVADEERLLSSGTAAAHSGSTGVAATAISASVDAAVAAGQHILQRQQQQHQQAAFTPCKEDNSPQGGSTQMQQRVQQKHQQQQNQRVLHGSSAEFTANAEHSQRQKQHQRQLAVAAAAHQGPVFNMPRLLQGIAVGAVQPQQHRSSRAPQQQLGGVQEHAELRFIFGVQQRRTIWLHVCTGLTVDFFPSTTASLPDRQNQSPVSANALYAGKWLTLLGQGPTPLPEEPLGDWAAGSLSYCYKDVRHMRGSTLSCSLGSSGRLSCGESPSWLETDDMFASLRTGPTESLSGAVLPTGAAMQESCACIKAGKETPDLLLPSLEEQRRLLGAAITANRSSSGCICSKQRLLLQGEVFVSRHAARLRPQVCFHLAVASTGTSHEASQTPSPSHKPAEVSVEHDGNGRTSSAGDDLDSLCAPVCEGLRQILRLCEKHAVGALLLPALLLETEASATCLPFAVLQRRMLSVLRCVIAELRAIALSPVSSSCCPSDASVGRLRHLVLLLPPIQQQQQEGSGQMNHLVQAAVNFLRNSACCC